MLKTTFHSSSFSAAVLVVLVGITLLGGGPGGGIYAQQYEAKSLRGTFGSEKEEKVSPLREIKDDTSQRDLSAVEKMTNRKTMNIMVNDDICRMDMHRRDVDICLGSDVRAYKLDDAAKSPAMEILNQRPKVPDTSKNVPIDDIVHANLPNASSEVEFVKKTIMDLVKSGKGSAEIEKEMEQVGLSQTEIENAFLNDNDGNSPEDIIEIMGALDQEELVSTLSTFNEDYLEGHEDTMDAMGNAVVVVETSDDDLEDGEHDQHIEGRDLQSTDESMSFVEVISGTCETHGYKTLTSRDDCSKAAAKLGRTVTWGPHGGYKDVVTGCSARFSKSSTHLFYNNPGVCDAGASIGQWTFTGCKCADWMPCLCEAPAGSCKPKEVKKANPPNHKRKGPGFRIRNDTKWPVEISLWQVGPLYWQLVQPGQYFYRETGAVWFTVKAEIRFDNKPNINHWDAIWPVGTIIASVAIAIATFGSSAALSASIAAGGSAGSVSGTVVASVASTLVGMGLKASSALYIATASVAATKAVVTSTGVVLGVKEAVLDDFGFITSDMTSVSRAGIYAGYPWPFRKETQTIRLTGGPDFYPAPDNVTGECVNVMDPFSSANLKFSCERGSCFM